MTIYALIPQDASTVHWAVSSAHYSRTAISRVCYATSAIALSIFNACSYLQQSMIHYSWQNMNDVGNSLLFSAAMVHHIFVSFFRDNVFAPPESVSSIPSSSLNSAFVSVEETSPLTENGETPLDPTNPTPLETPKLNGVSADVEPPLQPNKTIDTTSPNTDSPPLVPKDYASLPMSKDEEAALRILAKQLSDRFPYVWLIQNSGEKLKNVHPLRFLGFLYNNEKIYPDTDRTLKQALRIIRYGKDGKIRLNKEKKPENGFFWEGFVGPLSASMQTHLDKHDIFPYLESFAQENHADFEKLSSYFNPLDCTGLVDYLLSL